VWVNVVFVMCIMCFSACGVVVGFVCVCSVFVYFFRYLCVRCEYVWCVVLNELGFCVCSVYVLLCSCVFSCVYGCLCVSVFVCGTCVYE